MKNLKTQILPFLRCLAVTLLACAVCCQAGCRPDTPAANPKPELPPLEIVSAEDQLIFDLVENEDLVLDLTPQLSRQATWFEEFFSPSKAHPVPESDSMLEHLEHCQGLVPADPEKLFHSSDSAPDYIQLADWPVGQTAEQGNPWAALEAVEAHWDTIKFGVVSAGFDNAEKTRFTMHTKVEGRGAEWSSGSKRFGFGGHQDLTWVKVGSEWNLSQWIQRDFHVVKTDQPLFREVLAEALRPDEDNPTANANTLAKAQRSYKDELLVEASKTGEIRVPEKKHVAWTSAMSNYLFPSVSVVDYDGDGFDDLFLTARWGPTQMLRNQGDGTFTEVTRDVGLYFKNLVNCSLFADLDNDGDQDVILGRPLERSLVMMNENGKFVDVTDTATNLKDLYLVAGISVSDINRDGLLDIYFSTYAPLRDDRAWGQAFLRPDELEQVLAHQEGRNRHIDLAGPPNVLLMNRGNGRFQRVAPDESISQWRRSFQSVWSDIDDDGDDDLYICNDFAPDALLRNDTPPGNSDPVFVDVTEDVLLNKGIGFGMGASFGDFDHDGDLDLYVSNMYSKAGNRIIKQVHSVDPRVSAAAAGNFLFVNDGGKFDQRAGFKEGQFQVNKVGWSYGGQWADFDNDSELDLYVPSGFYTAPKVISSDVDT